MRFDRCIYEKGWFREITPRRLAAATRFANKMKDEVSLFPELVAQVEEPEDRLKAFQEGEKQSGQEWRDRRARNWREVRRAFFALDERLRRGLARYWSECSLPGAPEYLWGLVHEAQRGVSFWGKLRHLRQLKLLSQGRLKLDVMSWSIEVRIPVWRRRCIYDHDRSRFLKKRMAKLARRSRR